MMDTMEKTKITPEEYKRLKAEVIDKIVVARVGLPPQGGRASSSNFQRCD